MENKLTKKELQLWLNAYRQLAIELETYVPGTIARGFTGESWTELQAREIYDQLTKE